MVDPWHNMLGTRARARKADSLIDLGDRICLRKFKVVTRGNLMQGRSVQDQVMINVLQLVET